MSRTPTARSWPRRSRKRGRLWAEPCWAHVSSSRLSLTADAILASQWLADLIRRERGIGWDECSKARRFGLKHNPYTRKQETP